MWWKTKNKRWKIFTPHIHWVTWRTATPKDRDEVNRREVCECDGWVCVLEVIGAPSRLRVTRKAADFFFWRKGGKRKKVAPGDEMHTTLRPHASMCGTCVGRDGLSQRAPPVVSVITCTPVPASPCRCRSPPSSLLSMISRSWWAVTGNL